MSDSAPQGAPRPSSSVLPLPPGWSEYTAPSGQPYYYNTDTKASTYKHPGAAPPPFPPPPRFPPHAFASPSPVPSNGFPAPYRPAHTGAFLQNNGFPQWGSPFGQGYFQPGLSSIPPGPPIRVQNHENGPPRRHEPQDRPKHVTMIPDCAPWALVRTKLGRRFVHNTETKESFWKFPDMVMKAVVEFDRLEREKKEKQASPKEELDDLDEERAAAAELAALEVSDKDEDRVIPSRNEDELSSLASDEEYVEVEVTDDEAEEDAEGRDSKRPRTEDPVEELPEDPQEDQPMEFGEDDIAWQLEAMGTEYGLEPGEYGIDGEEDYEEGAEGLLLTEEDAKGLFMDLLDDFHISPFSTFDKVIEDGYILEDSRYTALTSMRARRDAWREWAKVRIHELKEARAKIEKKDPKIPYLVFLVKNATPKLYWPEFKRKYRKEPEMKDTKLMDKVREKLYRDYINRLKLPQTQLKAELSALLKSIPLAALNRSTQLATLPAQVLTDLRFYTLPEKMRNELVETYISTLPPPPEPTDLSAEDEAKLAEKKKERQKREQALRDREAKVEAHNTRQDKDLRIGKARMREGERELEDAMRVGHRGLRTQLQDLGSLDGTDEKSEQEE